MIVNDTFGVKDMLILLNEKVDDVLRGMQSKADQTEVLKLRERMHAVEGVQQTTTSTLATLIDRASENRDAVLELRAKVETLEVNQISEEAVAKALQEHQTKQRNTFRWAVGVLTSLGIVNILVNALRGGF